MVKNLQSRVIFILALTVAALFFTFPLEKHINLGLDLKGGMHLVLRVETDKLPVKERAQAITRAIEILRNRIDSLGAGETLIQRQGENEILVQLPGVTDRDAAIAMVGKVAQLEFRLVDEDPQHLKSALEGTVLSGDVLKYTKDDQEPILVQDKVALSGEHISDAHVDYDSRGFGEPHISFRLDGPGANTFGQLTKNNVGHRLAIILDGEVISAPNIQESILGGQGQITGRFSFEEASLLALSLRSGALPAPMHIEEERTIGPLLGKDSINDGINATVIGGLLVVGFMLIYYLKAGLLADIALFLNLLFIFGAMGFLKVMLPESQITLTLPGIAGIILTLGMAVDANILINERIREELDNGQPMKASINAGFNKALSAIIDSHVTNLIAAFMLFQFGSGPVKGFALTLTIGLAISLFTAVFVARTLFYLLLNWNMMNKLRMLRLLHGVNIDFISKRHVFLTLSAIITTISLIVVFQKHEKAYGIDFVGGQVQEYRFQKPVSAEVLREKLRGIGVEDALIQQFDKDPENVIIRTSQDTYNQVVDGFKKAFPDNSFETLRIERVGPVVGQHLRKAAILAMIFALGGILVYIAFRFKHFNFAAAGVIALIHDVIMALGVAVMLGRQIDLLMVTALLTIAGYSISDTIVIYDRVRDNMVKMRRNTLAEIINASINQTLGRTILTTGATVLVVLALFFRGGEILNTFALCLLVGFLSGTYSTIFIASPLVLMWEKNNKR